MKNEKGIDPVTNRFQVKYYFSILYPFPQSERPKALPVEWHIPFYSTMKVNLQIYVVLHVHVHVQNVLLFYFYLFKSIFIQEHPIQQSYCSLNGTFSGMLIVYWPIRIMFWIRKQTSKPQTNYRCCLRFSYLVPQGQSIRKVIGGEGNFQTAGIFFRYHIPCMNFFRPQHEYFLGLIGVQEFFFI